MTGHNLPGRAATSQRAALALLLSSAPLVGASGCLPKLEKSVAMMSSTNGGTGGISSTPAQRDAGPLLDADAGPDMELDAGCAEPCAPYFMSLDALHLALLADVITLTPSETINTRYLVLTHRRNTGVCGTTLERERWAMTRLLNSLSTFFQIQLPEPIDPEQVIYRIDLRDYGWNRPVTLNGVPYADGWEALISRVPSALRFVGDQADDLVADTATSVPFLMADAFVAAASSGDLYYALTGAAGTLPELLASLPVDVPADIEQRTAQRAGFATSAESGLGRVVERHAFAAGRVYWQAADLAAGADVLGNPLGFQASHVLALYSLPNRMPAYFIANAAGARLAQLELGGRALSGGISCMGCHSQGVLPVVDEVRAFVDANRGALSPEDAMRVSDLYVPSEQLSALVEGDRATFAAALDASGRQACEGTCCDRDDEPLSSVVQRYQGNLGLEDALGELGTTREAFDAGAHLIDPRLAALREGGSLDRETFNELLLPSLCVLASIPVAGQVPRNLLDPASCAAGPRDAG